MFHLTLTSGCRPDAGMCTIQLYRKVFSSLPVLWLLDLLFVFVAGKLTRAEGCQDHLDRSYRVLPHKTSGLFNFFNCVLYVFVFSLCGIP